MTETIDHRGILRDGDDDGEDDGGDRHCSLSSGSLETYARS